MTNDRITTSGRDIHVMRGADEAWSVKRGEMPLAASSYRLRAHAVAFARAVAHRAHADMIVHDLCGRSTRHTRASLSYPTSLD